MYVKELVKVLALYDENLPVVVRLSNGVFEVDGPSGAPDDAHPILVVCLGLDDEPLTADDLLWPDDVHAERLFTANSSRVAS